MTTAEFSTIGGSDLPKVDNDAVFYGATYEKLDDGSVIVVFGMSTTNPADGKGFAVGVIAGTPVKGALATGIEGANAVEGDANGMHTVAISFARNGRGFAVMTFEASAKDDAVRFAAVLAGAAQATPARSDATTTEAALAGLIGGLVFLALLVIGIVAIVRYVRRKKSRGQGAMSTMPNGPMYGVPMNPWGQHANNGSVQRPVPAGFPPPPPPPPPPAGPPPPPSPW